MASREIRWTHWRLDRPSIRSLAPRPQGLLETASKSLHSATVDRLIDTLIQSPVSRPIDGMGNQ